MMPLKIKHNPSIWVFLSFFVLGSFSFGADDFITLKYADGKSEARVQVLRDMKAKAYLPLMEVARFYGVEVQFDSQTRKVSLTNGKVHGNLALSQPLFMATDPDMAVPIEPVEMIAGRLGIPSSSVEDVFGTIMDTQVSYSPDQQTIMAGGVRDDELRTASPAQPVTNSSAVPATPPTVGVTQVAVSTVVPTLEAASAAEVEIPETQPVRSLEEEPSSNQTMQVRRIIIDAGHGGTDAGAPGLDKRYVEKEATLEIAQKVAAYLKQENPNLEVFLTRHGDYYITLKYRTDFANAHGADLFVSIHCNSNPRKEAHGTEIYRYGAKASNKWAAMAAERENGRNKDNESSILIELKKDSYKKYSQKLAEIVEKSIEERLGQHFRNIQYAPFYVLAHADMPAILVETAFISNQKEENKLRDPYWKDNMAKAIAEGILGYKDVVEGNSENKQARR